MTHDLPNDELTQLRAEIADLRSLVQAQATQIAALTAVSRPSVISPTPTSRRRMLKKLGAVAAGLAVAGGIGSPDAYKPALAGPPHPDITNDPLRVGNIGVPSASSDITGLSTDGLFLSNTLFLAESHISGDTNRPAPPPNMKAAIFASVSDDGATGNTKIGLFSRATTGTAVWGVAYKGSGVFGQGGNAHGVSGQTIGTSETGGVYGVSNSANGYGGIFAGGKAQLYLSAGSSDGAPTSAIHNKGEFYEDSGGNLFVCVASGTPGTWRKVQGPTTAGVLHILPSPDRFVDTDSFVQSGDVAGNIQGGTSRPFLIASNSSQTSTGQNGTVLPSGIVAVLGNLAVVPAAPGGGYVRIYANGATEPPVANINFNPAGGAISNSFTSALSISGRVRVYSYRDTRVVIDIIGYYL